MTDDKTEEQENNNEMENNLNEVQDKPSELETELNKATSDEEELNKSGAKFLDAGVKSSSGFERPNEETARRRNLRPEKDEQVYPDPLGLIPKLEEKSLYFELMLSDNFNSIRARLYDITNLFINKFEPCFIHIRDIFERVERIERDIAELKTHFAGVSPAKKTRAKRKAKTEKTGSPTRRGVNKVGAKRGRRPGKAYVANVSHPKRGIKKRGRGRPPATAGRKGRRS